MNNIIFLLGVPRSGSTLLQRILSAHQEIHSIAEPWLLLPLLTSFDASFNCSVYSQISLNQALHDLSLENPDFYEEYDLFVKKFVENQYSKISENSDYFLDKTPRYYLISTKLRSLFKESKFIYLIRNPLDVMDSTLKTFCNDRLYRLPYYYYDLTEGLNFLCSSLSEKNKNESNELVVHYEDLCNSPSEQIKRILNFLNLEYDDCILKSFVDQSFKGSFGDPNRKDFKLIEFHQSNKPLSFVRKRLYISILNHISNESLQLCNYKRDILIEMVRSREASKLIIQLRDLFDFIVFSFVMFLGIVPINKILGKKRFPKCSFLN